MQAFRRISTVWPVPCRHVVDVSRVTFVAFDVLAVNGRTVIGLDYSDRRDILDCLVRHSDGALVALNTFAGADLDDVLTCCEELAMDGS